jgi:hypothetical protein
MLRAQSIPNENPQARPHNHTRYVAGILIGIIVSLSLGYAAGFNAGVKNTLSNVDRRPPNWVYILVSGNVSIGSLGTPRALTFDSPTYTSLSSAISTGNNQNHYQVYLFWPAIYNVTIFYQDSSYKWQHCAASPGTFTPGSTQTQSFNC